MSMHEWNEEMYGIEFPGNEDNERLFNFLANHRSEISEYTDFPTCEEDVDDFVDNYEDDMGNYGIVAIVGDIISGKCNSLTVTTGDDGYAYAGVFAVSHFPWQNICDTWHNLTAEAVKEYIEPIFVELYGTCPSFKSHTIWYYG